MHQAGRGTSIKINKILMEQYLRQGVKKRSILIIVTTRAGVTLIVDFNDMSCGVINFS